MSHPHPTGGTRIIIPGDTARIRGAGMGMGRITADGMAPGPGMDPIITVTGDARGVPAIIAAGARQAEYVEKISFFCYCIGVRSGHSHCRRAAK